MFAQLARRLFGLVLCAPFAGGCALFRNATLDFDDDKPKKEPWVEQFERDKDNWNEVQKQRAKSEAEYRARNPGR